VLIVPRWKRHTSGKPDQASFIVTAQHVPVLSFPAQMAAFMVMRKMQSNAKNLFVKELFGM
jgi:hypothetical protein